LIYGSDCCALAKQQESRIDTTEMTFLKDVAGCRREDHFKPSSGRTKYI
jgi:hypothetical protein